jgi:NAD(P)-dependent dehydrogenase (short-subunit alcohol dehydrogenase family)
MAKATFGYEGRRVAVIGAASGIGGATVDRLLDENAVVHAVDVQPISAPVTSYCLDVRNGDEVKAWADHVGQLDVLINCAGVGPGAMAGDILTVNYLGLRQVTEHVLGQMGRGAAIVNVASRAGLGWSERLGELLDVVDGDEDRVAAALAAKRFADSFAAYNYSKELIIVYTMARAADLAPQGIRVNAIAPGAVDTPMLRENVEPLMGSQVLRDATSYVGRFAMPDEMAAALLFLGSDAASYASGVIMTLDHGGVAGEVTGRYSSGSIAKRLTTR